MRSTTDCTGITKTAIISLMKTYQKLLQVCNEYVTTRNSQGDKTRGNLRISSVDKLKSYEKSFNLSRELSLKDQAKEIQLLMLCKYLINSGIDKKTLQFRNLRLEKIVDIKWIEIKTNPKKTAADRNPIDLATQALIIKNDAKIKILC